MNARLSRLENVNKLIQFISERGRKFFHGKDYTAFICIAENGKYYFFDDYTNKLVFMWNDRGWNTNFTHGGGLKYLLTSLKWYIQTGDKLPGIVPYCFSDKNMWGYPEQDAKDIEAYAVSIGIVESSLSAVIDG